MSVAHTAEDTLSGVSQDMRNRTQGVVAETKARLIEGEVDDWTLAERVRAEHGRATRHTGAIDVQASQGQVTLSGPILRDEVDAVLASFQSVRGVKGVENRLEIHDQPGNIPSLQG